MLYIKSKVRFFHLPQVKGFLIRTSPLWGEVRIRNLDFFWISLQLPGHLSKLWAIHCMMHKRPSSMHTGKVYRLLTGIANWSHFSAQFLDLQNYAPRIILWVVLFFRRFWLIWIVLMFILWINGIMRIINWQWYGHLFISCEFVCPFVC